MVEHPGIERFLYEVRRRQTLVYSVRDTGLFAGTAAVALLALLLAAALLQASQTSVLVAAAVTVVGALAFALHLVRVLRRLRSETFLARLVGARFPTLLSDLLSAIELGRAQQAGPVRFSTPMVAALTEQTAQRLRRVSPRAVTPSALLRPAAVLLSAGAVAWACAAALFPDQLRAGAATLLAFEQRSPADLADQPLFGDLALEYDYPQHIGRPRRQVRGASGELTAPLGTRVRLRARALMPLLGAAIAVDGPAGAPARRIQLAASDDRVVTGELRVRGPGWYHFELRTIDDRLLRDPTRHRIQIEPDATSRITLHAPRDDTEVTARQRVELGFVAEDDFGLTKIALAHQVGSSRVVRTVIWEAPRGERKTRASDDLEWDLAGVDTRPGARIAYWLEALDNDTVSGPKRSTSTTAYLRVFSPEARHERTLAQHREVSEQAIRVLAERLLLFADDEPPSATVGVERGQVAHRELGNLVDAIRELRNRMRDDRLYPGSVYRPVGAMLDRLGELLRSESRLLRDLELQRRRGQLKAPHLAPLQAHNAKQVEELERDALLLANLLDEQSLQRLSTLAASLGEARQRLARLIERYRETRDERLRQQILREIRAMQQQLATLLSQMAALRTTIPDEYVNLEAVRGARIGDTLDQLTTALRKGDLASLAAALRGLDEGLAQLGEALGADLQAYRSGRMEQREQAFGALLDRLKGLEAEQRRLGGRTARVVQRYRRTASQVLRSRIAPFVQRQQGRLTRLRKALDEIDPRHIASYQREQLERIKTRAHGLQEMLRQRDLDQAMDMAERTSNGLRTLNDDIAEDAELRYGRQRARLRQVQRRVRRAQTIAAELEREIGAVFPEASALLGGDDRRELREVRRAQLAVRRSAEQLATELSEQPAGGVGPPKMPRGLRGAARSMGQALGQLGAIRPAEAQSSQETAAEQLAQLQRELRGSRQPRLAGQAARRQRVRIPGAESFRPPREFREELLEAMKEKAPPAFRRPVKRYYEELVR